MASRVTLHRKNVVLLFLYIQERKGQFLFEDELLVLNSVDAAGELLLVEFGYEFLLIPGPEEHLGVLVSVGLRVEKLFIYLIKINNELDVQVF